ncbi:MAG: tetratricopeptide repeat protein, partial [Bacteroidota bacterium]
MILRVLTLLLFSSIAFYAPAQNQVLLDSLTNLLDTAKGSSRVDLLNQIGFSFGNSDPAQTVEYAKEATESARKIGYDKGEARGLFNTGAGYFYQGTYEIALRYYLEAMRAFEAIENAEGVAHAEVALGLLYNRQRDYQQALGYLRKALVNNVKLDAKRGIGISLVNLGDTFMRLDQLDSALYYQNASRKVFEEIDDKRALAYSLILLGQTHAKKGEYEKALEYYQDNVEVCQSIGDRYSYVGTLNNIGQLHIKRNNPTASLKAYRKAIKEAENGKIRERLSDAYKGIAEVFAMLKQYDSAYLYRDQAAVLNDSLISQRSVERVAELQTVYETDKKEKENKALRAEAELQRLDAIQNQQLLSSAILGAILLAALSIALFRGRQQEKRGNAILTQKNHEIEKQAEDIQLKNENITASITYAKRIQEALLPLSDRLKASFGAENVFVLYKPRDIVSGDFYWVKEVGDYLIFAVSDCTGHGVPGALMSMIGSTTLSKIVGEKVILMPDKILARLHRNISESL